MSGAEADHTARKRGTRLLIHARRIALRIAHGLPVLTRPNRRQNEQGNVIEPLMAFTRYNRAYFQRWLLIGALIGVGAGISMAIFFSAIYYCTHIFLGLIAGYIPPEPTGEGRNVIMPILRPWLIPVATTLGGLVTGFIVFTLAPETKGGGTDASIKSFHQENGHIRWLVPPVKLVASAVTIGSGGSAGREGAAAQIVAGIGSWVSDVLHLDNHDRRIAVIAGIGSGIGTVFRAPFAGALFAAEVPYKRDFEADALFPTFIAAVVGYAIYGAIEGWSPVFGLHPNFTFNDPRSLGGFLILGVFAGALGFVFHETMHRTHELFDKLKISRILKPAIGGLLVGLIGMVLPQTLGMGYGWVQFGVDNNLVAVGGLLLAVLVLIKILATALTMGSGGSGGDVAPAMVAGGFLGGALWSGLHAFVPVLVQGTQPGAFVIVGMASFFGGISKTPLAMILMVAEMTGQLSLIVPAMLATMLAYIITGDTTIYQQQVPSRLDSPAHKNDYALPLLQSMTVSDAMLPLASGEIATSTRDTSVEVLIKLLRDRRVRTIPITDQGRLVGVVTARDLARIDPNDATITRASQIMSRSVVRAYPEESLYVVWLRMMRRELRQVPVVERSDPSRLLGVITQDTIAQLLRPKARVQPLSGAGSVAPAGQRTVTEADRARMQAAARNEAEAAVESEEENEEHEADETASATPTKAAARDALAPMTDGDPLAGLHVADAMLKTPRLVRASDPLSVARRLLDARGSGLMVVDDDGRLVGIVTRTDLYQRSDYEKGRLMRVGDVAVRNLVTVSPDDSLRTAVRKMSRMELRQLPVVAGELPAPPVGLLRRSDILGAYERAITSDTKPREAVPRQA